MRHGVPAVRVHGTQDVSEAGGVSVPESLHPAPSKTGGLGQRAHCFPRPSLPPGTPSSFPCLATIMRLSTTDNGWPKTHHLKCLFHLSGLAKPDTSGSSQKSACRAACSYFPRCLWVTPPFLAVRNHRCAVQSLPGCPRPLWGRGHGSSESFV